MINMIRAEKYRLTKTKGFYIFWGLILLIIGLDLGTNSIGTIGLGIGIDEMVTYSKDIMFVMGNFNFYFLLLMPIFSIIIGEFSDRIVKNTISSATSKGRYFIYKYVICVGYGLLVFLVVNIGFYGLHFLFRPNNARADFGLFLTRVMSQVPVILMLLSVFVMAAFLMRKGAAYNSVMILIPFLFEVILGICMNIPGLKNIDVLLKIVKYELSTVMYNLGGGIDQGAGYFRNVMIGCFAITVISFVIGYRSFKKREL